MSGAAVNDTAYFRRFLVKLSRECSIRLLGPAYADGAGAKVLNSWWSESHASSRARASVWIARTTARGACRLGIDAGSVGRPRVVAFINITIGYCRHGRGPFRVAGCSERGGGSVGCQHGGRFS